MFAQYCVTITVGEIHLHESQSYLGVARITFFSFLDADTALCRASTREL